ncbi:N-acetylglucosamine-6-phosphate deacetylase [Aneurinibacillus sp. Ricciae_BoGa-3]|uniref:N-acetylglucosamine-6-phosphate deacetylase n=1 Tax=Aneurinibacillus sp. Ricciae_BoGa-3 TaxID=3022697 RepID=UPI0023404189|nr:N-acetylglucosamine-6-phosphate deacetylase [Aneurinibacillus sp. Ricciae_BoGa-3]WCK53546.1 N-acetylglucosamine-6-phosphate deacetylase [Aneurinibacillus sp. Ricciae_BoGa-3]
MDKAEKVAPIIIRGAAVYSEKGIEEAGYILIEDGKIGSIGRGIPEQQSGALVLSFPAAYKVVPGMIDLHIHGAAGADVMDASREALKTIAAQLPAEGTTGFLATTMTQTEDAIEKALGAVAGYMANPAGAGAEVLGVHLEGPFISPKRAGAQPVHLIREMDIGTFDRWQSISGGNIKLVTLAPERQGGLDFTRHLAKQGVVASIGHSDATYAETVKGIEAGITHATHLYNGMRGLHHRDPGVAGAVLLYKAVKAELIADGIHVHPDMVSLTYKNKGSEGLIIITDAMRAKCLGSGTYELGGQEVRVGNGRATLADGTLAGSVLQMRDAVRNTIAYTGCSLEEIVQMTSTNPARQIGVFDRKGSLAEGKDADIVVLNEDNGVVLTLCRGRIAYKETRYETESGTEL